MRIAASFRECAVWACSAILLWAADTASAQAAEASTIAVSVSESALPESAGTVRVRLTLENPPEAADGEGYTGCRLRLGSGSEAETPADVTFSNQKKLRPSNGWSAEAKLMTVVDDTLAEGDETLVVEGHCTGSKKGTRPSHEELASRPLTLTIVDDDEAGAIALSASPGRIAEDGGEQTVTVTAEAEEAPDATVTVSLEFGSGFYAVTGTRSIEIAGGATSGTTTLTFAPTDDGNASDDRVTIEGSAPGYVVAGTALTIEEPPAGPPPRIVASVTSTVLPESAGRVRVRLTLENPPDTADDKGYTGCRLRLGAGGDAGSADVTFSNQKKLRPSNGWSAEARLLTVVDDDVHEGDETLVVEGHCTGRNRGMEPRHTALESVPLTLTVQDDDRPRIVLTTNPVQIGEADGEQTVTVMARADMAPEGDGVTVDLDFGQGSYAVTGSRSVRIGRGGTSGSTTLAFEPWEDGNTADDEIVIEGSAPGHRVVAARLTVRDTGVMAAPVAVVPLFLNAMDPFREGLVRVINRSARSGEVRLTAVDDTGWRPAPVSFRLKARAAVNLTSGDVEDGNRRKGLADGVGRGTGQWRLLFDSGLDLEVLSYVRTPDGYMAAVHDVAPNRNGTHRVATFNPGSDIDQVSTLRVVNLSPEAAAVSVKGYGRAGVSSGGAVRFEVPANAVREFTAADLESGAGVTGSLGAGSGRWRLEVISGQSIAVMSLLRSPEGYLSNLSSMPAPPVGGVHALPLFPAASDPFGRQGFARLISRSSSKGDVTVRALDRSGTSYPALTVALDAWETAHFDSDDLERTTGSGAGDWRLELTSALDIDVLSYVRAPGGFLTAMHDVVPSVRGIHYVPTFNAASNRRRVSRLLTINPGSGDAEVTIEGTDDSGGAGRRAVLFTLAAGAARTLDASELESGGDGVKGRLGDGTGKWRLAVAADRPILVVNLLESPTRHLTNLSGVPD